MTETLSDNEGQQMTRARRLDFLSRHADLANGQGLEIGPLCWPIVRPQDIAGTGRIRTLDHLDTAHLREKYRADTCVSAEDIVDVDFVCPDGNIVAATGGQPFDYIVASHVVEHVANLVAWLDAIERSLTPGGVLFLVVPDKRFTLDYARPVSTPGQYVAAYLRGVDRPGPGHIYDHLALVSDTSGGDVWSGEYDESRLTHLHRPDEALTAARAALDPGGYVDVHCGVFTPASFFTILRHLTALDLVSLTVAGFEDVPIGDIEFFVALEKPAGPHLDAEAARARRLERIPVVHGDTYMARQNTLLRHVSQSLHGVVSQFNAQEHRQNVLDGENARLREEVGILNAKIAGVDDDTLQVVRHNCLARPILRLFRWLHRLRSARHRGAPPQQDQ